jgi:glycosyltransferase involved in cell wall biosynthesis
MLRRMAPVASIIVCTRNRAQLLEPTLLSLLAERPSVGWELIVVDNASTDETAAVCMRCRDHIPDIRFEYLVEERLGLSHARNKGIAAAVGEYLLFTDDDVLVQSGWIDSLCVGFDEPNVLAVAGRILPHWPSAPPRWLAGRQSLLLALTDFGDHPRDLLDEDVPVGANMAIRASTLEGKAAPFDPRLGNQGADRFAYEEFELFLELRRRGRLVYRPDAVVLHRIAPDRMTWKSMRRESLHNGFGSRQAERFRGRPTPSRRASLRDLALAYTRAKRHSRRNGGRQDVDPESAFKELGQYWNLGRWIEVVFGSSRLGRWLVGLMA